MKKNVGPFDGFFRIVLGMLGFVAVILFNWWWGLIGLIFIGTAFSLYCPLYDVLDINTNKDEA